MTTENSRKIYLEPGPSFALDVVRFLAALMVAIGHLSLNIFTTGWPPVLMDFAVASVAVFFVLSGFVIRCVTSVGQPDLRRYTVDRFARIYSVALPALALTIVFDTIAAHASHSWYFANFVAAVSLPAHATVVRTLLSQVWFRGIIRIFFSVTMLSQSWFQDISPLSNSPFWSLSYECVYYALFGISFYLRGSRRVLGWIIVFLLIGPTVFLLFPLWLLGCAAYDVYKDGFSKRSSLLKLAGLGVLSVFAVHGSLALVEHFHLGWFNVRRITPFMDFVAVATVAILLPLCMAIRNVDIPQQHPLVRLIKRLADATFPLYLIHLPLFVLLTATIPFPHAALWPKLVLLAVAVLVSVAISRPCDNLKNYLRKALSKKIASPVPDRKISPEKSRETVHA